MGRRNRSGAVKKDIFDRQSHLKTVFEKIEEVVSESFGEEEYSLDGKEIVVFLGSATSSWNLKTSNLLCEKPKVKEEIILDMSIVVSIG